MMTTTPSLDQSLRAVTARHGVERLEVEWRLGSQGQLGFHPGVSVDAWEAMRRYLDAAYPDGITETRTAEYIVPGGGKLVVLDRLQQHWMFKNRLANHDISPSVRVSMSIEDVRPARPNEPIPPSSFARFKERRSYRVDCWSIDLTKVAATADIDCDTITYEVEIELADPDILFVRPVPNILEWGSQLATLLLAQKQDYLSSCFVEHKQQACR